MMNQALRCMRVFHDLTQKELAEKLEISTSHLSEIESAKKTPTLQLLDRYSEVFDVPASSIMFFSENIDGESVAAGSARKFVSSKILTMMKFIAERSGREYAE